MNDLREIKKRIYNQGKIEDVLKKLGCDFVKTEQRGRLFVASLPDGSKNKRTVQIKNTESLITHIRSKGINGDIYTLISYIINGCITEEEAQNDLFNAKKWLIETLGYQDVYGMPIKEKVELNGWLKELKKKTKKNSSVQEYKPNLVLDEESIIREFVMQPYAEWIKEGISYQTQIEFETGFDPLTNRVINIIRNQEGQFIGVKGRTLDPIEAEFGAKYLYIYKCNKSIELYNLHRALPYILEKREAIIWEGYKSVFKAHQFGFKNSVSIEGDKIHEIQASIIKQLGLDIKIILCFDKDKEEKYINEQAKILGRREIYVVFDSQEYLSEKDSPVDKGKDVWCDLYNNALPIEFL